MLKLTRTGIGLLTRQYRSVLHKCWLINVGLWQAMGDAVSKAVSVPARLVASLLSGGALNGEAFNVLDEILLSRLFERKLSSLTAVGLTIAALALPSKAEAMTPSDMYIKLQQKSPHNIAWTGYSTTGTEGYDAATNKGTIKIAVDGGDYYFNYIYNTPTGYTETSLPVTEFTAENVQNKAFEAITTDMNSGVIYLSSSTDSDIPVISDFIGNIASDSIAKGSSIWLESAAIGDITGNFIGNYINATSAQAEGGAIDVDTFIETGKQAKVGKIEGLFIGNHTIANSSSISAGGAVWSQSGSIIEDIHADFIGNYTLNTAGGGAQGGAIFNNASNNKYGNIIHNIYDSTFTGNYAKSKSGSAYGGAIYNTGTIENIYADFKENYVTITSGPGRGGAIYNNGTISNVTGNFIGNYVTSTSGSAEGGAIYNIDGTLTVCGNFIDNHVQGGTATYAEGAAIGNAAQGNSATITVYDATFIGNIVQEDPTQVGQGGAIHNYGKSASNKGIVNLIAQNKDIIFYNNKTNSEYNDYTGYDQTDLNLDAASGKSITFNGKVIKGGTLSGLYSSLYINNNSDASLRGGNYVFNNAVSGQKTYLYNNAQVKFGAVEQGKTIDTNAPLYDANTTYGSFDLVSLQNDTNGGLIDMINNHIDSNTVGTLTLNSNLKIGIDIQHPTSGTTGLVDNITYTTGSGSIIIDAINEIGGVAGRPTATGTYLYQVLNGSGVTLALDTALKNAWASRKITTGSTTPDTIAATTNWGTTYYYRTPYEIINGTLNASGNNLVYTVNSINPGEDLEKMGDTLALVTTATNNASRIFSTTDATAEYLLSTNLGAVNAVYKNLSINGTVSGNNRSTLNLGNYNGFVLDSSDDNLSLNNVKVSGGNDYSVNLANSGSKLDVANVIMDSTAAPITGAGNVEFTGDNEINAKVLNTGTTTVSSGTTDFNDEVAGFTVAAPATVSIAADDITAETTNNGTLELEGGNVTTKLMGTGRMKLMSGNVRLLSSTPPATTGSLSFGSSSDYADSILTSSSAASTSDHALVTAGYLDNNYYMNYRDSMTKSFIKAANDNHKSVIVRSAKHDVTIFGRKSDNTATTTKQAA